MESHQCLSVKKRLKKLHLTPSDANVDSDIRASMISCNILNRSLGRDKTEDQGPETKSLDR